MSKEKIESKSAKADEIGKRRKPLYSTPVLRTYGAVSQLTSGSSGGVNDAMGMASGQDMGMGMSDRAVKQNIVRIGTHPAGFGLYLFDYKPAFREKAGFGRQFGVMADEVELVMPQAVSMHSDGYKRVDYTLLGIVHPDQSVH